MTSIRISALTAAFGLVLAAPAAAQIVKKCPPDSVKVGNACVDTYEASVWYLNFPLESKSLVKKIEKGTATLTDLQLNGAMQLGCTNATFNHHAYPSAFPADGNWTPISGSSPPTPGV